MEKVSLHSRRKPSIPYVESTSMSSERKVSGVARRVVSGPRSKLRLSVACNVVLLFLLFLAHNKHFPLSSSLVERWDRSGQWSLYLSPERRDQLAFEVPDEVVLPPTALEAPALEVPVVVPAVEAAPVVPSPPPIPYVGGECSMCAMGPELCGRIGEAGVLKSLSYGGSGDRIRRMFAKLRQGERLTVGVVGGSVSGGHGLYDKDYDMKNTADNLNRRVFDHLDKMFPAPNGWVQNMSGRKEGKNSFISGALGGMGTGYFSKCYGEHLPDDVDLVIVEQAINDEAHPHAATNYELLVRSLLDLPRKPAIINMHVFQLLFAQIFAGGDMHHGVAEYYDLPVLSIRNPLLYTALNNQSFVRELFYTFPGDWTDLKHTDFRHIGPLGHLNMGQIGIAYLDHIKCEMEKREAALGLDPLTLDIDEVYPVPEIPRLLVTEQYDEDKVFPKLYPMCLSTNSEKNKLKMAEGSKGWREWNWEKKNYLVADEPGSIITFEFTTYIGEVTLNYLRSAEFGLGSVQCWVDEDTHRSQWIEGYWNLPYNIGQERMIRDDLEPGQHELHCLLLEQTMDVVKGGHEFRIISLMSM